LLKPVLDFFQEPKRAIQEHFVWLSEPSRQENGDISKTSNNWMFLAYFLSWGLFKTAQEPILSTSKGVKPVLEVF